jgi:hypothetical protein
VGEEDQKRGGGGVEREVGERVRVRLTTRRERKMW